MDSCQNFSSINSLPPPRRSRHPNWGQPGTFRPISAEGEPSFSEGPVVFDTFHLSNGNHFYAGSQDVRLGPPPPPLNHSRSRGKTFHRRKFQNRVQDSTSEMGACGGESLSSEVLSSTSHYHQHTRPHRKERRYKEENGSDQPPSLQQTTEMAKPKYRTHRSERNANQEPLNGATNTIPKKERTYKKHSKHPRNFQQEAEPSAPSMDEALPPPTKPESSENGYKDPAPNSLWEQRAAPSAPLLFSDRGSTRPPRHFFNSHHHHRHNRRGQASEDTNRDNGIPEFPPEHTRRNAPTPRLFEKLRYRHPRHQKNPKAKYVPDVNYNEDDATQRERLTEQLKRGDYECMVCCEPVLAENSVWNCPNCYNIFHLNCIHEWAETSVGTANGPSIWRCPACQHQLNKIPIRYMCFCGKMRNPDFGHSLIPHSCGNSCGRHRSADCPHPCTIQCHPGPCPECTVQLQRTCPCGKSTLAIRCSMTDTASCDQTCDKLLSCCLHRCELVCHTGDCPPCTQILSQKCYCGKDQRKVSCTAETSQQESYSCGQQCDHSLGCEGNHRCTQPCHPPPCASCPTLPHLVTSCPCGKVPLDQLDNPPRKSCTDPIPTCNNLCLKPLPCNPAKDEVHTCQSPCHDGPCPPCPLMSGMKCRCGGSTTTMPCRDLAAAQPPVCDRRCKTRKSCGMHRCQQVCCTDSEHLCELTCNKKLSCGLHQCQLPCHLGKCPPCPNVSFEDLPCRCGKTLRLAPIPCGAVPLECKELCNREHPCGHPVTHQCHNDPECPPCPALTEKWCFGKHELRGNVPCFIDGISCGKACGKPLPCGKHTCQQLCHAGPCDPTCSQPCPEPRPDCKHPCAAPCHRGPCPRDSSCKVKVPLTCACGRRSEAVPCGAATNKKPTMSLLSSKMQNLNMGQSVDISELLAALKNNARLECNEECAVLERNRRLAEALQIDPVEHKPSPPSYSEFLKEEARKNPEFVKYVYDTIHSLVTKVSKQSKLKSQSYSFPSMKNSHRHIVHEVAEAFGCQTQAFDLEPNRNVVVTAIKHLSTAPTVSIMTVVQQEAGLRKVPTPVNSLDSASAAPKDKPPPIDYFDYDI